MNCRYCKDTGMVLLATSSKPCLDCPRGKPQDKVEEYRGVFSNFAQQITAAQAAAFYGVAPPMPTAPPPPIQPAYSVQLPTTVLENELQTLGNLDRVESECVHCHKPTTYRGDGWLQKCHSNRTIRPASISKCVGGPQRGQRCSFKAIRVLRAKGLP